ncbi:MAG: SEC-C domain-containing protein [Desulfobacteraceae bacterium]|nr:SEC-C domain-containing protein [Desulfobacteraceae bacterium]
MKGPTLTLPRNPATDTAIEERFGPPNLSLAYLAGGFVCFPMGEHRDLIRIDPVEIYRNPEPGRNTPCPCGSEKKYKKCCLLTKLEVVVSEG